MRFTLLIFLIFTFTSAQADNEYCKKSSDNKTSLAAGYSAKFCFGSENFMNHFEQVLIEEKIPHIRYLDGSIGYKSINKKQVQLLGNDTAKDYLNKEGRFQ